VPVPVLVNELLLTNGTRNREASPGSAGRTYCDPSELLLPLALRPKPNEPDQPNPPTPPAPPVPLPMRSSNVCQPSPAGPMPKLLRTVLVSVSKPAVEPMALSDARVTGPAKVLVPDALLRAPTLFAPGPLSVTASGVE